MRTIILTLLIAMNLMARGQESYELLDFLTDEIVKESNGYIADTQFTEKHKIHVIEFPEYFDFDIVSLTKANFKKHFGIDLITEQVNYMLSGRSSTGEFLAS